jgi:prepilin-type N-terminal cleavage/methylation domain-containing protein
MKRADKPMKKLLKSQKGMTLVELVVGMVMFAIAVGAIGSIMVPTLRVYAEANEFAESNNLVDTLANQILDDLSEATAVTPGTGTFTFSMDTRTVMYSLDTSGGDSDGILLRQATSATVTSASPMPVFTKDFYKRKSVSVLTLSGPSSNGVYQLTIGIERDDGSGTIPPRTYAVRPVAVPTT